MVDVQNTDKTVQNVIDVSITESCTNMYQIKDKAPPWLPANNLE